MLQVHTFCPSRTTVGQPVCIQLLLPLIEPESRFKAPGCSGMSANVDSGMTFMLIATRCFAAVGPPTQPMSR